jgi:hypothetical protein
MGFWNLTPIKARDDYNGVQCGHGKKEKKTTISASAGNFEQYLLQVTSHFID